MFDRLLQLSFSGRDEPGTGAEQLQDEVISYGRNILFIWFIVRYVIMS